MAEGVAEYLLKLRTEGTPEIKAAAKEVDHVAESAKKAESATDSMAVATKRAGDEVDEFGNRAGRVGGNAAKLAGALGLVDGSAAEAARTVADLADVGEVAAEAASALGVSMGSMVAILGPVAVAVAALAATWGVLNAELEEAESRNAAAAEAASAAQSANEKWNQTQEDVKRSFKVASGQIDETTAAIERNNAAVDDAAAAQRALLVAELDRAKATLAASGGSDRRSVQVAERNLADFDRQTEATKLQAEFVVRTAVATREADERRAAAAKAAAEQEAAAAAAAAATAKLKAEQAQAAKDAAAAVAEQRAAEDGLRALASLGMTEMERIAALRDDQIAKAIRLYEITGDQLLLEQALAGIEADIAEKRTAAMNRAAQESTVSYRSPAGTAGDALSAAAGAIGDPLGAIATAGGPLAAGIIAAVQAAADLGGTLDSLRSLLGDVASGLAKGGRDVALFVGQAIGELAPAVLQAIPSFVLGFVEAVPAMIEGIAEGLPQLAVSFIELFTPLSAVLAVQVAIALVAALADPQTWVSAAQAFAQGLGNALDESLQRMLESLEKLTGVGSVGQAAADVGSFFGDLFAGTFASGTDYVPRTGLALVHQGERIVGAMGTGSGTAAMMTGGGAGGVTVNLGPGLLWGVPSDLAREVGRAAERGVRLGG